MVFRYHREAFQLDSTNMVSARLILRYDLKVLLCKCLMYATRFRTTRLFFFLKFCTFLENIPTRFKSQYCLCGKLFLHSVTPNPFAFRVSASGFHRTIFRSSRGNARGSSGHSCAHRRRNCGCCSLGKDHPSRSRFPTESNAPCIVALLGASAMHLSNGQSGEPIERENELLVGKINKRIVTLMEFLAFRFLLCYLCPTGNILI